MDEQDIQQIVKQYLLDNLKIEIYQEEENEIDVTYVSTRVKILLGKEEIVNDRSSFRISKR